jgi:hypothetical protein
MGSRLSLGSLFRASDRPNLRIEMLTRLLSQEIKLVGKRNLVVGRTFSEMLASSCPSRRSLSCLAVTRDRTSGDMKESVSTVHAPRLAVGTNNISDVPIRSTARRRR